MQKAIHYSWPVKQKSIVILVGRNFFCLGDIYLWQWLGMKYYMANERDHITKFWSRRLSFPVFELDTRPPQDVPRKRFLGKNVAFNKSQNSACSSCLLSCPATFRLCKMTSPTISSLFDNEHASRNAVCKTFHILTWHTLMTLENVVGPTSWCPIYPHYSRDFSRQNICPDSYNKMRCKEICSHV